MVSKVRSFWRAASRRGAFEDEMAAEMRFHIDSRAAELVRRGVPPDEAARRARLEFGSVEKHKEESRASFGLRLLDEARGDTRYALRTFARNRTFTATAIATLALGIGANTAMFSLFDALMLRWLPVPNPQALLQVRAQTETGAGGETFSYAIVRALDGPKAILTGVAPYAGGGYRFLVGAPESANPGSAGAVAGAVYGTP